MPDQQTYTITFRQKLDASSLAEAQEKAAELAVFGKRIGFYDWTPNNPEIETDVKITANYSSINVVKEVCGPWIEIWSGDEWGDVMGSLFHAIHTDYGLDDEDVARLTRILWNNVASMREWINDEGHSYGISEPDEEAHAAAEARKARNYWLKGGNLGEANKAAVETINSLPEWLFSADGQLEMDLNE